MEVTRRKIKLGVASPIHKVARRDHLSFAAKLPSERGKVRAKAPSDLHRLLLVQMFGMENGLRRIKESISL